MAGACCTRRSGFRSATPATLQGHGRGCGRGCGRGRDRQRGRGCDRGLRCLRPRQHHRGCAPCCCCCHRPEPGPAVPRLAKCVRQGDAARDPSLLFPTSRRRGFRRRARPAPTSSPWPARASPVPHQAACTRGCQNRSPRRSRPGAALPARSQVAMARIRQCRQATAPTAGCSLPRASLPADPEAAGAIPPPHPRGSRPAPARLGLGSSPPPAQCAARHRPQGLPC
mmetsp:Transcript_30955/g.98838  ORF Transcript_30955/g.98838 Transcript_30955/m.98838 type:complete len:226 (-) Transcript_30955:595-1272(-)